MYYLPATNQGGINCSVASGLRFPNMTGKWSYLLYQPRVQMSLSLNRRFSQLLLRVYQMAEEVLSPEWEIQLTQHSPQTQMSTFYTFHSTKKNLQSWYTRRKVYPCISTLKVLLFTRDILQIRPDQDQELISLTTELNKPWANDAQSVASTRDIS